MPLQATQDGTGPVPREWPCLHQALTTRKACHPKGFTSLISLNPHSIPHDLVLPESNWRPKQIKKFRHSHQARSEAGKSRTEQLVSGVTTMPSCLEVTPVLSQQKVRVWLRQVKKQNIVKYTNSGVDPWLTVAWKPEAKSLNPFVPFAKQQKNTIVPL